MQKPYATPSVGAAVNRVEGEAKVTGAARYAADTEMPGARHAVLVVAEAARGEITAESMSASSARARAAPGVLHVLTPLNCPRISPPPTDFTDIWPVERRPPLADLKVHHVGQYVAVVVADTFENATYAASLFVLTYRESAPETDGRGDAAVRSSDYCPDHWVEVADEKLQDLRGNRSRNISGCNGFRALQHSGNHSVSTGAVRDGGALGRRSAHGP